MAMSEQCTAPHMFRQQARAMRSLPGIGLVPSKYSCRSSMTHFTTPGCVGGCRVAVDPALGMDDAGDGVPDSADGVTQLSQVGDEGIDVGFVREQELTVVPGCEAEESAAVLVRQFGELPNPLGPHEPWGARPDGEELVAGLTDVDHDARLHDVRGTSTSRSSL